jgi:hypothetical protein
MIRRFCFLVLAASLSLAIPSGSAQELPRIPRIGEGPFLVIAPFVNAAGDRVAVSAELHLGWQGYPAHYLLDALSLERYAEVVQALRERGFQERQPAASQLPDTAHCAVLVLTRLRQVTGGISPWQTVYFQCERAATGDLYVNHTNPVEEIMRVLPERLKAERR